MRNKKMNKYFIRMYVWMASALILAIISIINIEAHFAISLLCAVLAIGPSIMADMYAKLIDDDM